MLPLIREYFLPMERPHLLEYERRAFIIPIPCNIKAGHSQAITRAKDMRVGLPVLEIRKAVKTVLGLVQRLAHPNMLIILLAQLAAFRSLILERRRTERVLVIIDINDERVRPF